MLRYQTPILSTRARTRCPGHGLGGGAAAELTLSYSDDDAMVWRTPRLGEWAPHVILRLLALSLTRASQLWGFRIQGRPM